WKPGPSKRLADPGLECQFDRVSAKINSSVIALCTQEDFRIPQTCTGNGFENIRRDHVKLSLPYSAIPSRLPFSGLRPNVIKGQLRSRISGKTVKWTSFGKGDPIVGGIAFHLRTIPYEQKNSRHLGTGNDLIAGIGQSKKRSWQKVTITDINVKVR